MLLSSSKFTRTMMDDFVDQDWFEESAEDEVVKPHPLAGVEQQQPQPSPFHTPLENGFSCFHSAPPHGQTDFLELNVPVDEMFFGTAEGTMPQLTELDTHCQQQQQKMVNCPSSNAKIVQEVHLNPLPIECHQLGTQSQIGALEGANGPAVQQNGHGTHNQQRECFYADWPPTTSSDFSTVRPTQNSINVQKQNGRDEQQQQRQRHAQQPQQQQQRWTTQLGGNNGIGQRHQFEQQNEYGGTQTAKLNGSNAFPTARIIVHDQSANHFPQQSYGCSSGTIESHQNVPFHNNLPNSQNVSTFSEQQQQQQQIVLGDGQIQQRHFSLRVENAVEFRPVHQNQFKSTKRPTKMKPSANNNQTNSSSGTELAQGSSETKLDQIATMLFSNSNLATVQFDPQRTIEFGIVLEQTKQLREQEEQGIDVREQLRACEARIAELVQNAMAQQGNGTTASVMQGTTAKRKSKARKKAPPKTEQQNVQRTDGMAQQTQMHNVPSTVPLSNGPVPVISTCHQPVMLLTPQEAICQPSPGNAVGLNPDNSNKFKQYTVHSELPSASSFSHNHFPSSSSTSMPKFPVPSLANSLKISSPVCADVTPTEKKAATISREVRTQKQQIKKEEKSEAQIAQEKERERVRRETEREKRRTKLSDAFSALRSSIPTLDYKTPFSDKMDCVKRLLPFGLYSETELSDDFLQKFDGELQRHSEFLCERMDSLKERFQSIFLTESLCEMKEQRNLLLRLDVEFEKAQLQKATEAKGASFPFPINSSCDFLDWEYDDSWDRDRYRDISPFVSPPQSPPKIVEETEDEMTDDEETDQKEGQMESAEGEDEAATAKIGNICLTLPKYAALENGTTNGQSDEQHSPNNGLSEHNDEELEQSQRMSSERSEEDEKDVICSPSNELKVTQRSPDELVSVSVHSFAPSSIPQHFPSETTATIPSAEFPSVPLVPSLTSEILLNEFLRQNVPTFSSSNCDNKPLENDGDSALLCTHENGAEIKLDDQQESSKEEFRERMRKEKEQQEVNKEPVKLKIKLDKMNVNKVEERNDHENGKEEKKDGREKKESDEIMRKAEKKRRKAEKKEKKKQAKLEERMKKEQKEREELNCEPQPNPSSVHLQNGDRQPTQSLKISLSRLACWKGTNNVTPEYSSNLGGHGSHPNKESVDLTNGHSTPKNCQIKPENGGGDPLKLRLILNRGANSSVEVKSTEHRKKSRKRKSHEEKPKPPEEKEEAPPKVPRLKIRIGTGNNEEKTETNAQPKTVQSQYSPLKRGEFPGKNGEQMEESEQVQQNSLSPPEFYCSNDNNRIQFSPCCSEESDDDELRNRTNELFSKLCQD
ncbi:hypothetical protein niasHT_011391 [Heterodera trifolii]|uniref:GLTSCR protein conserved domain-containing protein n=1 Tax=Heterodera trifolii TaxID=157864 RepID=A0ABD2LJX3_9BILA